MSLQYAHENGCPWDEHTCTKAASSGSLACLQYARENGCPWNEEAACTAATRNEQWMCLKYLHERNSEK